MQQTSTAYQVEMKRDLRAKSYVRIKFGAIDLDAADDSTFINNDGLFYSSLDMLAKENGIPTQSYATFENHRLKMDGTQLIPSIDYPIYQGYVSNALSNAYNVFDVQPIVTIDFTKTHTTGALSFVFDNTTGQYPAELNIIAYRNGEVIKNVNVTDINNASFVTYGEFKNFDKLDIIFIKSKEPFQRARLQQIIFGFGKIFDNESISNMTQTMDIDPIMRRLPTNTLNFTIINENDLYNPDNPNGIWEALESQSPITVEYGQMIREGLTWGDVNAETWGELELIRWGTAYDGNYIEWIDGGRYLLAARPTTSKTMITFPAEDLLSLMTDVYKKSDLHRGGISLYDLSIKVLEDAGLIDLYEGIRPYKIHDSLKGIYTYAPMPKKSHKDCLQLIAHASRCVLYTDREGYIRIEPISSTQDNFHLDFDKIYDIPEITKIPTLYGVNVKGYSYTLKAESELHKSKLSLNETQTFFIEFAFATDIIIEFNPSIDFTKKVYGGAVEITTNYVGDVELIIRGKQLETSTTEIVSLVANADTNGEIETVDNPLVTDLNSAKLLGEHIRNYLLNRTTYEFDSRGNPEIDATDLIYMQSKFDPKFSTRVLKSTVNFNGALRGSIIAKRMEVHR